MEYCGSGTKKPSVNPYKTTTQDNWKSQDLLLDIFLACVNISNESLQHFGAEWRLL
ncbi:MAG: hypothetical protein HFH67_12660 [Lachnospiraceae bacterium]|nr:hypothetical protein [Lachnospiraceae bacterium]